MRVLVATATIARQGLVNALYRPLAAGLRGADRLLVLDGGGQPIVLPGGAVEVVRWEGDAGAAEAWNHCLRRAFVEADYDALMILGDNVRLGAAQVAAAKALLARHADVDLLLSYWGFDVQVHRRGNERTIGPFDARFGPAASDDYGRTMTERGRLYQRFHELDPLPGSVHGATRTPQDGDRRAFASKWPGEPYFEVNRPSAPHYHTNRHVAVRRTAAGPASARARPREQRRRGGLQPEGTRGAG